MSQNFIMSRSTNLSDEDITLCQQLRDRVSDMKLHDAEFRVMDFNMIRFLRARSMNLDKAEDMFRKYIAWREENDVDDAINWDVPQDLLENFQYKITGLTQEGGLVICVNIGDWDPAKTQGRYEDIMKTAFHEIEKLTLFSKFFSLRSNSFSKLIAIINLEGLTFAHCTTVEWIKALITLLKAFEAYYPETLKQCYLLSAPWVFSILWSITKPFISNATHQRLRFLGPDKTIWNSEITKYVDEDQFPEAYGGSLPDDFRLVMKDGKVLGTRTNNTFDININDEKNNKKNENGLIKPKPVDAIELD